MSSELQALEHSTLIVPYECLNRTFRNAQKVVDREVARVDVCNDKLKKLSSKTLVTVAETEKELDELMDKVEQLECKITNVLEQEIHRLETCTNRLDFIKEQACNRIKKNIVWKKNRLDRLLIDYFLRSGYYESAMKLIANSSIKDYVDLELFSAAREVEAALQQKNINTCLHWCHANKSKLKKLQSTLEVNIRIQEFVEIIKKGQRLDAVVYARKHFSFSNNMKENPLSNTQITVMTLLAFKPSTQIQQYKELFDDSRWAVLVNQFRKENLALHQLHVQSMLEIVLQCGLASMKTPHCFHEEEHNHDCPVCSSLFNELARPLPFSHAGQSRLLCSISGERMDEHNHPLMLPNGNVYGEMSLANIADENNEIICHKSQQCFALADAKKVYIM